MKARLKVLIAGDAFCALLAMATGFLIRFGYKEAGTEMFSGRFVRIVFFVLILLVVSHIFELYKRGKHSSRQELFPEILKAATISFLLMSGIFYLAPDLVIGRGLLAISLVAFVVYQVTWHSIFSLGVGHPAFSERIIIIGTGPLAVTTGELVEMSRGHFNHQLLGYASSSIENGPVSVPKDKIIGEASDLMNLSRQLKATRIIVSISEEEGISALREVLLNCKLHGMEILDTPAMYEQVTGKLMLENINIMWLIYANGFRRTALISAIKRMTDIILSIIGLILTIPLSPLIALLVKIDSPGPIFYSQVRVGYAGQCFVLYKFRTMAPDAESGTGAICAQEDDPRLRPIGKFLRKCRLDEIPQLYNVLKGDMSFVGPRPERPEFVDMLKTSIPFYQKRHFVKPGITGWAQINYPYGASVEDAYEKLRFDLYYIKHMSPLQDALIVLQTFKVIMLGKGGR